MSETFQGNLSRPEVINTIEDTGFGVIEKPLGIWERIFDNDAVRKGVVLVSLALVWEFYARWLDNSLLFPTFLATAEAFFSGLFSGRLLAAAWGVPFPFFFLVFFLFGFCCGFCFFFWGVLLGAGLFAFSFFWRGFFVGLVIPGFLNPGKKP